MPALTNIHNRINSDLDWKESFYNNETRAKSISDKIHLIHVSGHYIDAMSLFSGACELPTSDDPNGYCSDKTRATEAGAGFPSCLYFYAGRAHEEFGPLALAFPPSCEEGREGSATPFDSGGFYHKYIKWSNMEDTDSERTNFIKESLFDILKWRARFSTYLAAYFENLYSYWDGFPWKPDPEGLFEKNDDWRAWVFELRFHEKLSLFEAEAWCERDDQPNILWRLVETMAAPDSENSMLSDFLDRVHVIKFGGTPYYCEEIESWTREQVGL